MESMWKLTIRANSEADAIDYAMKNEGMTKVLEVTEVTRIYEVVCIKSLNEDTVSEAEARSERN